VNDSEISGFFASALIFSLIPTDPENVQFRGSGWGN
jgi:hypothetical protein